MVPPYHIKKIFNQYLNDDTIKEYLAITYGNHLGFIDEFYAKIVQHLGKNNPTSISIETQHNISRKYFTAWFQYHLRNLDEYYTYIYGEEAHQDLDTGLLSELSYNMH